MNTKLKPDAQVCLLDPQGARTPIKQLPTSKGLKTLGVRLAPLGDFKDEFLHRKEAISKIVAKLVRAHFTRYEARLALRNVFWNKLSYPLWVTDFSKTQCRTLQKLFMKHFLPRIGYNRKMPLVVIHGPTNIGGLGLLHVEYKQGLLHSVILL